MWDFALCSWLLSVRLFTPEFTIFRASIWEGKINVKWKRLRTTWNSQA